MTLAPADRRYVPDYGMVAVTGRRGMMTDNSKTARIHRQEQVHFG
jgi:hypothetical protein